MDAGRSWYIHIPSIKDHQSMLRLCKVAHKVHKGLRLHWWHRFSLFWQGWAANCLLCEESRSQSLESWRMSEDNRATQDQRPAFECSTCNSELSRDQVIPQGCRWCRFWGPALASLDCVGSMNTWGFTLLLKRCWRPGQVIFNGTRQFCFYLFHTFTVYCPCRLYVKQSSVHPLGQSW